MSSSEAEASSRTRPEPITRAKTFSNALASKFRRHQTSAPTFSSSDSTHPLSKMISKITIKDIRRAETCGSGSYGMVRVMDFPLKGKVALKELRVAGGDGSDDLRRRALREGDTWRRLKHPNVLPFLGIIESPTDLYLVSLYAKNGTLKEYIVLHPEIDRGRLLWEVAIAIAFLHGRDIIHGDIKALNVLVSDDVHALICDFGLTRPQADATSVGLQGVGTIRYESPELLARGSGKTLESDVWAFGMTVYEVLSSSVPFFGLSVSAVILAITLEDKLPPTIPTHSPSGLSYDRIWDVAKRCWHKVPTQRPSMELVSQQLRPHVLQMEGHKQGVSCVTFAPDGHTVVSGSVDCTLRLWDVESASPKGDGLEGHTKLVSCLAFSPDGTTVVSGSYDHTLRLWDVGSSSRKGRVLEGHSDWVRCLGFSPDGRSIASGSNDRTLRLWDVEAGRQNGEALEGHTRLVSCLSFSPDGRMVASGSFDSTLRLWDTRSGNREGTALEGHRAEVQCLAFSPDGNTIASGSSDHTVRLWDVRSTSQERHVLTSHVDSVQCLAFSPDGRTIASGSRDHSLRLWDAHAGSQRGETFHSHTGQVNCLAFSSDS